MLTDLLNRLLEKRGLVLQPTYTRDISDPFLLKDMAKAVKRILLAVKNNEKIIIFADYDADGVPGAVVLAEFFRKINYLNFEVYIPNRQTEDYGLSEKSLREFAVAKANLVITIDCGISNLAEVKLANSLGLEVIITDHHLPPPELPAAYAIINPKQPGDTYPDPMLCGAAVAWKLVQALVATAAREDPRSVLKEAPRTDLKNWEKTLLDLVAIATISDRVPLRGENRALAKFGLLMLQRTRRLGLLALFSVAKLKRESINEDDVGFTIGPRINSAGRMSHASEAYLLLTTANPVEARAMAEKLEKQNGERKKSVENILRSVLGASLRTDLGSAIIVVGDESWSPGVLGLAASRLAEKYHRPVFVWGAGLKGSCRSDGTVNLVELMREAGGEKFFTAFGGHAMAAGFSISLEIVPSGVEGLTRELERRLLLAYQKIEKLKPEPAPTPDATLDIDDVNPELWRTIEQLAPYGTGNPKPLFFFPNLTIATAKTFGNGGIHLELGFRQSGGQIVCAVGFFDTFPHIDLTSGRYINLTATLEKSYFRPTPELRLRILDISLA